MINRGWSTVEERRFSAAKGNALFGTVILSAAASVSERKPKNP
jgi:hypothetical protein